MFTCKTWLLLAVGLWAFLVPSWALVPGNPACGPKIRVWDFFAKTGISCLANQLVSTSLASGKVACVYGNRVDPNCCGEQWDQDLGLYYNRARYLNTDSGRFWNADDFEGATKDPGALHKYLYANANPVSFSDPSGRLSLAEVSMVGATVGILAKMAVVSYRAATGQQYTTSQILKELAEGAGYGALGAVVGFYTNPVIISIGRATGWYGVFGAGTFSGAVSASSVALFKEFVDFYILGKPTTFKDAQGRVINATAGGFMTGGLFTVIRFVPKIGPSAPKEVGFDPISGEAYVYTPYQNLGPAYYQELNDAANLGATPANAGVSVIEKIVRQGINFNE